MSEVRLQVGGKSYTIACEAGEEDRVAQLGAMIDGKLRDMGRLAPQEAKNLLFASLLLADELQDTAGKLAALGTQDAEVAQQVEVLRTDLASKSDALTTAQRERDEALHQNETLQTTLQKLKSDRDNPQTLHTKLQEQVESLEADVEAAQQSLAAATQRQAPAAAELAQLREEVAALRSARTESAEALRKLEAERDAAQDEASSAGEVKQQSDGELAQTRKANAALKEELEATRSSASVSPISLLADPDVLPALERFAGLLEECATKLETSATAH
ncbi:Myosin-3 [Alteripontixanthobacter maritimus]|uniref:Myosin-3 n=1 Tax=Alteripontixanthobacter maritimus TaxID=2161824 RepID=A0A369Q9Y5_9SPHN|nr:cell division protein ZapA [Alteripontixanthobacter maritimus]RDC59719.1 Myosin-3 [Alteripontixanthobacter maritimus]